MNNPFITRNADKIIGVLSGFDRLVIRGTLRLLAVTSGMMYFLGRQGVRLTQFRDYVKTTSERLKEASLREAEQRGRPVKYLYSGALDKEAIARAIAKEDGVDRGLICVLKVVEPCWSYEIRSNRRTKMIELVGCQRKCTFLYHYLIDPIFGFMHGRIQTWFPFNIQICLNGREILARQLDRHGVAYEREGNCFPWIADFPRAQRLMDRLLRTNWPQALGRIGRMLNPAHRTILHPCKEQYYWSVYQSEWATDVVFRTARDLAAIYSPIVRHAITTFQSPDVMRFLGKRFQKTTTKEIVSDYRKRTEGIRIKHRVGGNSVKAYDKGSTVLRVETTVSQTRDFRVYRPKEGDPGGKKSWRPLRKGVADLHRLAQVSQNSNERYLEALASVDTSQPLVDLVAAICRPVKWNGHRVRAIRPWSTDDRELLTAISRGELAFNGLRNRDLQRHLYKTKPVSKREEERRRSRVTRQLRMLRAHRLIRKVPSTHRYVVTTKGRQIVTAILATQTVTMQQLNQLAA